MALDQVPMLTRGPTALALGGEEIIKDLPKGSPGGVYTFTPHPKLQKIGVHNNVACVKD